MSTTAELVETDSKIQTRPEERIVVELDIAVRSLDNIGGTFGHGVDHSGGVATGDRRLKIPGRGEHSDRMGKFATEILTKTEASTTLRLLTPLTWNWGLRTPFVLPVAAS